MERQRCQQSQGWNVNPTGQTEVERSDIFSPDDEYFTPPVVVDAAPTTQLVQTMAPSSSSAVLEEEEQEEVEQEEQQESIFNKYEYQSHTIKSHNKARKTILPLFPPRSALISMVREPRTAALNEPNDFLLCNVPSKTYYIFSFFFSNLKLY
jgi:hypothetical protein